jgi:hypothetical protein
MTLTEHIDRLDKMVTDRSATPEIRSQIALIGRQVAALQADYRKLEQKLEESEFHHSKANDETSRERAALNAQIADFQKLKTNPPGYDARPPIMGRMDV